MKNILGRYVNRYEKKHKNFRRYAAVVAILALIVFVGVNWRLHDKGISMTADYQCGLKEHKHTAKCYKKVLICGKKETDGSEGHTHTAACYKEERKLTCGKEEHKHTADCYDEEGNLICDKEEHTHTKDCYTIEKKLICGKEESKPVAAHHHTDACYKKELICGLKEHTHTAACYSNESADVEKKSDWEATIPALSGNWAEDVVSVAESQLGYEESTANFKLADDGKTRKGYTRYGEWYGNKYGDWSAMFASFCLNYAKIPAKTVPVNSGSNAWITELKQKNLYKEADKYEPVSGDLVFLDTDGDSEADHVGIITETETKDDVEDSKVTSLTAIVGDSNDAVEENTYEISGDKVMGYCALPENPDVKSEATTAEKAATTGKATEKESTQESKKAVKSKKTEATTATKKTGKKSAKNNVVATQSADGVVVQSGENYASLSPYVTALKGKGTIYDTKTGNYTTELHIDFEIPKGNIQSDNYNYEFKYPEGIIVPDNLNDTYALLDSNDIEVAKYYFVKNADGTYSVKIKFDEKYINNAGNTIKGNIWFEGKLDGSKGDDSGNIVIKGEDSVDLDIPNKEIEYPEDETNKYNIDVKKDGAVIEGGKLKYTVTINSKKGTPGDIDFSDIIKTTGMNLGTPEVTVKKKTVKWYDWGSSIDWNETGENVEVSPAPVYDASTGKLTMTLPKITATKNNDHIDSSQYIVTYIYDITGMDVDKTTAANTVNVKSQLTGTDTTVKDEDSKSFDIKNPNTISKSGEIVAGKKIKWTITVNSNKVNIAGATVSDTKFKEISPKGTEPNITPADKNYDFEYDSEGNIKNITFKADSKGKNTQTYTITYYTSYEQEEGDYKITNDAVFKPSSGKELHDKDTVEIPGCSIEKKLDEVGKINEGKVTLKWTVSMDVPKDGLSSGTIITDDMTKNKDGKSGEPQYMTVEQVIAWAGQMQWDNGEKLDILSKADVIFKDAAGNTYTYNKEDGKIYDKDKKAVSDIQFTGFDIKLKEAVTPPTDSEGNIASKLIYSYETTADLSKASKGENKYYNTVSKGEKTTDAEYIYNNNHSISKKGSLDAKNNRIKWTIVVNRNNADIAGATVSDTMFKNIIPKGTKPDIDPADDNYDFEYDSEGNIKNITFKAADSKGQNTKKYTITYYTESKPSWNKKTETNTATLHPGTGEDISATDDVDIPGGSASKKMDTVTEQGDGKSTVKWNVTITAPGGKIPKEIVKVKSDGSRETKPVYIYDNMSSSIKDGTSHYMTIKQIQDWNGQMQWGDGKPFDISAEGQAEVTFKDSNGKSYTLDEIRNMGPDEDIKFVEMKINFLKDLVNTDNDSTILKYSYDTTVDLSNSSAGKNKYTNKVQVENKSGSATYTYDNKHTVSKTAEVDGDEIKWTITVNENQVDIAGGILKDEMFEQITDITKLKVNPEAGAKVILTDDGKKVKEVRFESIKVKDDKGNESDTHKNTNKYTITYYTPYEKTWGDQNIFNKASFKPPTGKEIETTKTITIPGCSIEKTTGDVTENGNKIEIPWTVSIEVPNSGFLKNEDDSKNEDGSKNEDDPSNAVITDDMIKNQAVKQYMTVQQVQEWNGLVHWDNSEDTFNISDYGIITFFDTSNKGYSFTDIIDGKVDKNIQFTKFTIELNKKLEKPYRADKLIYTYKTTADLADASIGANNYCNTVSVGEKNVDATYVYNKGGVVKKDGNGNTGISQTTSENELTWKIEVTTDSKEYNKVTVTDNLPSGLKLKEISVIDSSGQRIDSLKADESGNISGQNNSYKVTGKYANGAVNLELGSVHSSGKIAANSKYTFTVICQTDDDSKFENGKTYTFKNTSSVAFDEKTIGSSDQTQEWTKKVNTIEHKTVEKSGEWLDKINQAQYTILLNADAKDLVEGTDVLTLEDIFNCQKYPYYFQKDDKETASFNREDISIRAELLPDSIKLYYAEMGSDGQYHEGNEVTGWKWEYNYTPDPYNNNVQHKLTVSNIPDGTALIFKYTYAMKIDAPGKVKMVQLGGLSNTAKLSGVSNAQDGSHISNDWYEQKTGGGISTDRSYTIYKVERGNFGKFLSGAKFKLQKYDKAQKKYVDVMVSDNGADSTVKTFNTTETGKILIKWDESLYQYNTLYHLVETEAPNNYNLSDEDSNVYFYFSSKDAANNLPDNIPTKAIDLTKRSYTSYVENDSNLTDITVKKNWEDSEGNITNATSDKIKFDLYQQERDTNPTDKVNVTLKYGKDWEGTVVPLVCNKGDKVIITLKNLYSKPNIRFEGSSTQLEPVSADVSGEVTTYTYEYEADKDAVICTTYGYWRNSPDSFEYKLESKQYKATKLGEYTITKGDHWQKTIEDLPLTGEKDGKIVYYTYYIKEQNESAYKKVQYANNDGINSGTITVTNTTSEAYNLPETGGSGTLPFITVGASLMGFALLCGYSMRRRRGRRIE